jgi:hypothetical protein
MLGEVPRYDLYYSLIETYITDKLTDRDNSSEKLLSVIYGPLEINLLMDLQTDKKHKKKHYPLHFIGMSSLNLTCHL